MLQEDGPHAPSPRRRNGLPLAPAGFSSRLTRWDRPGETVLDYAVFDAIRGQVAVRAVFVIRREFEGAFCASVTAKYAGRIAVDFVFQSTDDLPEGFDVPAGREKPWGTGHAVWCARAAISGTFAVINADDFYGASSYSEITAFLGAATGARFAIVGFRLANTLSENGTRVPRDLPGERGQA